MKGARKFALFLVSLMVVCAVPVLFFSEHRQSYIAELVSGETFADQQSFAAIVIVGLFSSDIFLPIPSSAVCAVAGKIFGVLAGTLLCWIGLNASVAIGYLLGWFFGWSAVNRFSSEGDVAEVKGMIERWGIWPIIVLRPMPVLSEASILMFGTYRFPIRKFLLPVLLANLAVAATFVAIGNWFSERDLFAVGLLVSIAIPVLALLCWGAIRKPARDDGINES